MALKKKANDLGSLSKLDNICKIGWEHNSSHPQREMSILIYLVKKEEEPPTVVKINIKMLGGSGRSQFQLADKKIISGNLQIPMNCRSCRVEGHQTKHDINCMTAVMSMC